MWFYSETFLFLLAGTCMGAMLATLGAIGYFFLALFGKEESAGEVRVGKFLTIKGASLILTSVCGVALMGGCVYAWIAMRTSDQEMADDDTWWPHAESLGYVESGGYWEEDLMWETLGDDDSADVFDINDLYLEGP